MERGALFLSPLAVCSSHFYFFLLHTIRTNQYSSLSRRTSLFLCLTYELMCVCICGCVNVCARKVSLFCSLFGTFLEQHCISQSTILLEDQVTKDSHWEVFVSHFYFFFFFIVVLIAAGSPPDNRLYETLDSETLFLFASS